MKIPKELTTVTPLSKFLALALFIKLPILFFFLGMRYQSTLQKQLSVYQAPVATISATPAVQQMPALEQKVLVSGTIVQYDEIPEEIDGEPKLILRDADGTLFEVILPSGETACTVTPETKRGIQSLKINSTVEVYGASSAENRIVVCSVDDYIRVVDY